jgi:hypothetical protein
LFAQASDRDLLAAQAVWKQALIEKDRAAFEKGSADRQFKLHVFMQQSSPPPGCGHMGRTPVDRKLLAKSCDYCALPTSR